MVDENAVQESARRLLDTVAAGVKKEMKREIRGWRQMLDLAFDINTAEGLGLCALEMRLGLCGEEIVL